MNTTSLPSAPTRVRTRKAVSAGRTKWKDEEDQLLISLVNGKQSINWNSITEHFPGKTPQQISERWNKVIDPKLVKGGWTPNEDMIIIKFVSEHGPKSWTKLANLLPGRVGKQCRERWLNHLDPNNNYGAWTEEEEALLIELQREIGNKWTKIAQRLPGRSENCIKNHWYSMNRRKVNNPVPTVTASNTETFTKPSFIDSPISPKSSSVWTPQRDFIDSPGGQGLFLFSPLLSSGGFSPWSAGSDPIPPRPLLPDPEPFSGQQITAVFPHLN